MNTGNCGEPWSPMSLHQDMACKERIKYSISNTHMQIVLHTLIHTCCCAFYLKMANISSLNPTLPFQFFFYISLVQDDNNKRVMTFKMVKKTNLQFVTRTKSIPQISSQAHCKTLANLLQVKFSQEGKTKKQKQKTNKTQKLQIIFLHYSDEWLHLWFYHYVSDGMFFMLMCWCKNCNKNNKDEDANLYNVWITEITSSWNSK